MLMGEPVTAEDLTVSVIVSPPDAVPSMVAVFMKLKDCGTESLTVSVTNPAILAGAMPAVHNGVMDVGANNVMTAPEEVADMPAAVRVELELIRDAMAGAIESGLSFVDTM